MKRIIAVMAAIIFAAVLFNINVSANDMTAEEYETYLELKTQFERDYLNLLSQYEHGQITYEEFKQNSDELTQRYNEFNTDSDGTINTIAQNVSNNINNITNGIGNAVGTVGEGVKDWIDDVLNPYATTKSESSTDMQGYGSLAIFYPYADNTEMVFYLYSNSFGTYTVNSNGMYNIYGYGGGKQDYYYRGTFNNSSAYSGTSGVSGYRAQFFGDWRNPNDTTENLPTNDIFVEKPCYDFSNATDREIEELLNELNETLKREQPDLSTMEGLLESIYYRLGSLDSDDDNALLSDINKAILALSTSNDENAASVISALAEVREAIENMSTDIDNNFDDLQDDFNKIADFEIPTELFIIDFDSLSDEVKNKVNDIVELITTLVAKGVPMAAINGGLTFYQDIIFNSHDPQDITFDLTFNGEQYSFTILSTSFFGSEGAQALQIIKNFVAIVLGYAWVLAMRKKAVSMMY